MPNPSGQSLTAVDNFATTLPRVGGDPGFSVVLRPTVVSDIERIVQIAAATNVFTPEELVCLRYDIEFQLSPDGDDDWMLTLWNDDGIVGFLHFGPLTISEGGRMLFWIFVSPAIRSSGAASMLMRAMEEQLKKESARIIFIETSDTPDFIPARRFYMKHGYEQVCVIPEYYAPGVGKAVFSKLL